MRLRVALRESQLMNVEELRIALAKCGVRSDAFGINGVEATEEQYRLENQSKFWVVYYFERGNRVGLREFHNEEDACSYFLDLLKRDPTTHIGR
jgi:hypothetical protein